MGKPVFKQVLEWKENNLKRINPAGTLKVGSFDKLSDFEKDFLLNASLEMATEIERLNNLIHTPHTDDFIKALPLEAAFQIEHWGSKHDEGKEPTDWLWLIGWLAGKATNAAITGDIEKAKHHCISVSAVMLNWFRRLTGDNDTFRPGIGEKENGK